jgi:tRNA nucleotidyltransferase (CCA-adding enzyme)
MRHVSPAFAEDPVRILRVARFAARFADFSVAPETLALMRDMVAAGEVDALVAERVWQELARGLMEAMPSRMFAVLRECGALVRLLPELDALWGVPQRAEYHPEIDTGVHVMMVIDMAARLGAELPARFAALTHDLGKARTPADILPRHHGHETKSVALVEAICERLRVPIECRDVARLVARFHGDMHRVEELRADTMLSVLERCDALRRPERFELILLACEADYRGRLGWEERDYAAAPVWRAALAAVRAVDAGGIAKATTSEGGDAPGHRSEHRPGARRGAGRSQSSQPINAATSENTTTEAKGKEYSRPRRRKRRSPGRRPAWRQRDCIRPITKTVANRTISHFSMDGAR